MKDYLLIWENKKKLNKKYRLFRQNDVFDFSNSICINDWCM